ncbi:MAG: uroporphyrinogen decarboxylase family protein [Verrucomicrobiota bacterium]
MGKLIEERKARWTDFYDLSQKPSQMFLIRVPETVPEQVVPMPDRKMERIEWAWNQYRRQREKAAWLDDDAIPYLHVHTGTEIFAAAFGSPVHQVGKDMPCALPFITDASQVSKIKVPDLDTPCLRIIFEIADELKKRAGPDAILRMVDVQSPMGIASSMWAKDSFFLAITDQPEAVKELAAKVNQLIVTFLEEWFQRYGAGFVAHYPDYYMPKGITLSEDEIGCVGPEVFHDLFRPELAKLSQHFGGIGLHCCANARHQWAGLKSIPGLKLLNLNQSEEVLREAYSFFGANVPQMHIPCVGTYPLTWKDHLDGRVVLEVPVESKEQAIDLAAQIRKKVSVSQDFQLPTSCEREKNCK